MCFHRRGSFPVSLPPQTTIALLQTSHFKTLSTRLVHLLHSPHMSKDSMLKAPATMPQNSSVLPNGSYLPNLVHTGCGTILWFTLSGAFPCSCFMGKPPKEKTRLSIGFTSVCSKCHLVQATFESALQPVHCSLKCDSFGAVVICKSVESRTVVTSSVIDKEYCEKTVNNKKKLWTVHCSVIGNAVRCKNLLDRPSTTISSRLQSSQLLFSIETKKQKR